MSLDEDEALVDGALTTQKIKPVGVTSLSTPRKEKQHDLFEGEDEEEHPDPVFVVVVICFQIIFLILFAIATDYTDGSCNDVHHGSGNETTHAPTSAPTVSRRRLSGGGSSDGSCVDHSLELYSVYQDVHGMIFVGFGFLMTFLRRYAFGAVGFNMLISAFAIQWTIITFGLTNQGAVTPGIGWGQDLKKVHIDIHQLLDADLGAAVCLISFGALLGRVKPLALLVMSFIEIPVYAVNFYICTHYLRITDVGGSIVVHTFGAYFGLAVSFIIGKPETTRDNKSMYHSDLFAMIGTLFLWLYWPSFNAFFAPQEYYHKERAFANTVLALSAGTVMTFACTKWLSKNFNMVHIQNSTLAAGVAVGAAADLYLHPAGAVGIGMFAGAWSVFGYAKIHEILVNKMGVFDTCGVHNLHGMPGIIGGLVSAIAIAASSKKDYERADPIFPWYGSDMQKQAAYQVAGVVVTVGIAIVAGLITGLILKGLAVVHEARVENPFHDTDEWEVPHPEEDADMFRQTLRGRNEGFAKAGEHADDKSPKKKRKKKSKK